MRAMGAPDHVIAAKKKQWQAQQPEYAYVEVYPENIQAFLVFLDLAGQWEYPGAMGGRLALPHTEIWACVQGLGNPNSHDTFRRVIRIAAGATPALRERFIVKSKKT